MNQAEKETITSQLKDEEKALKDLEKAYKKALKDTQEKIRLLNARSDLQNAQSVIYQKKYQQAIKKQINDVLDALHNQTYTSANDFFTASYQNGYVGSMYELQSRGIPLTIPVSTSKMKTAIQTKSKLSQSYYEKQGLSVQNIRTLKKQIAMEITRGIASGKSWLETAESVMVQRQFQISQSDAMRIVRTEGNRINQQARLDAGDDAVDAGCDLLKQWDATLDGATREDHRVADGQIVEWHEDFTVGGEKMSAPSIGGSAKQVCNCRCQLLKRPRWALDEEELEALKKRADYYGLDKTKNFEDYKKKYLNLPANPLTEEEIKNRIQDLSKEYADTRKLRFKAVGDNDDEAKERATERLKEIQKQIDDLEKQRLIVRKQESDQQIITKFPKHEKPITIEEALSLVNPNYQTGADYQQNCGYCSVAYDMQRRGFNVEAKPKRGLPVTEWMNMWDGFTPLKTKSKRRDGARREIEDVVKSWGDGARGTIYVRWGNTRSGHFFNVENKGGKVMFVDAQCNDNNCGYYFNGANTSYIYFGRTDNLSLSKKVLEAVKSK